MVASNEYILPFSEYTEAVTIRGKYYFNSGKVSIIPSPWPGAIPSHHLVYVFARSSFSLSFYLQAQMANPPVRTIGSASICCCSKAMSVTSSLKVRSKCVGVGVAVYI